MFLLDDWLLWGCAFQLQGSSGAAGLCRVLSEIGPLRGCSQGLLYSAVCISEGDIFKQYECSLENENKGF